MPGKRSTTPLFDLLQQGRSRGVEVRVPDPERHRPADEPPPRKERRRQKDAADGPIRIAGGVVQMPLAYAGVALTVALAAVVLAWTLGYNRGEARVEAEHALLESVMAPGARITEPEQNPRTDQPAAEPNRPRPQPDQTARQAGPAPFLTSAGPSSTDPRTPRENYLHLAAQLEAESAASAIDHLASRGIEAFAEIDPRSLKRKNGPLYSVIAAKGVPSGEVRSEAARRFVDQVKAAGAAWKQAGGKWDFADAYWKLYSP